MAGAGPRWNNKILKNGLRAWAGGAIVLLLFLTPLLNYQVLQSQESIVPASDGQRSLASVDGSWELKISEEAASLLKEELVRGSGGFSMEEAGIGRRPDSYDRLAFGVLEGKYQFHLENGKIREIDLVDQDATRAKLDAPTEFLKEFKDLLLVSYSKTKQRSQFLDQKNLVTIYDLMSDENARVGQVSFVEDQNGGLQRVTIKHMQ